METKITFVEDGISVYLDYGWIILEEDYQEKICSLKSVSTTKDCNINEDKGCKLKKQYKIGVEKIYLLEKITLI